MPYTKPESYRKPSAAQRRAAAAGALLIRGKPKGLKARHWVFFAGVVCIVLSIAVLAFSWSISLILMGLGGILVSVASMLLPNGMRQ